MVPDGVFATDQPASQIVQAVHPGALAVVLKVSPVHGPQCRSLVAVPSAATKVPGPQTLSGEQGVAGLWSWSQVPITQAAAGLVPPAQY